MSEEKLEKYWNKVYYDYLEQEEAKELIDYYKNMEQENKQLKVELQEANDNIIWWSNRFNAVERDNKQLKEDKKEAIKYINRTQMPEGYKKILLEILGDKE